MQDTTKNLSFIVVAVCAFRFLLDGISIHLFNSSIEFPHVDAASYASILTPVLGAHGYTMGRRIFNEGKRPQIIDNPDSENK